MVGDSAMTAHPLGSQAGMSAWTSHDGSSTYRRADLLASVRAGVIVLVLLVFLMALILL